MPKASFDTTIGKLEKLKLTYLFIPQSVVQKMGGSLKMRVVCVVNKAVTFQAGFVSLEKGDAYIILNAKRLKELGVKIGDVVSVELKEDKSEYGMEVPEELAELLKQDEEGMYRFKLLSKGKQRYIIYYVSGVKSSNLRLDRALKLITNLKKCPVGKEEFRDILGLEKR
jgi:antitoxin component of MazEF toxin-antitoxin module